MPEEVVQKLVQCRPKSYPLLTARFLFVLFDSTSSCREAQTVWKLSARRMQWRAELEREVNVCEGRSGEVLVFGTTENGPHFFGASPPPEVPVLP